MTPRKRFALGIGEPVRRAWRENPAGWVPYASSKMVDWLSVLGCAGNLHGSRLMAAYP